MQEIRTDEAKICEKRGQIVVMTITLARLELPPFLHNLIKIVDEKALVACSSSGYLFLRGLQVAQIIVSMDREMKEKSHKLQDQCELSVGEHKSMSRESLPTKKCITSSTPKPKLPLKLLLQR